MRGYLTTEALTGDYACRRFLIPVELLPIFMGALYDLTFRSNYEQFGALTPTEMVEAFRDVLDSYTTQEGDCETMAVIGVIEWRGVPPYPDTGDSVLCDGGLHLKSDYPDYWNMIVNTGHQAYWEYDATRFGVPNLINRFIRGSTTSPGNWEGADSVTLEVDNLPPHTHVQDQFGTAASVVLGELPGFEIAPVPGVTGSTGDGQPFDIVPGHVQMYPYIRLRGTGSAPAPDIVNRAGEIVAYYGTELPEYSLACDGVTYAKATYPLLWAALETELVGAVKVFQVDANNFKVPDLRGRTLIGYGQGSGLTNRIDPVANIGAETHALSIAELAAHTHTESQTLADTQTYGGGTARPRFVINSVNTGSTGSGTAHNNMQPSRSVRYAIRYA